MKVGHDSRGAALIIAVVLLLVLMLFSLVFYSQTRLEVFQATNMANAVRAEQIANAGVAMAMATLNHDAVVHPESTSRDHAWKTYFNGMWSAEKAWMYPGTATPHVRMEDLIDDAVNAGLGFDHIYIPRIQGADRLDFTGDFVVDPIALGRSEADIIDGYADIDVDGDGFKDSVWVPVPIDLYFDDDGLDNDLDGWIDEGPDMGEDGKDNNGDGNIDDALEVDAAAVTPAERGVFLYRDGATGDVVLTSPLWVWVDHDSDPTTRAIPDDLPPFDAPVMTIAEGDPQFGLWTGSVRLDPAIGSGDVDGLDNDFSQIINDALTTLHPNAASARRRGWPIAPAYFGGAFYASTGEPVCSVAGRVAVLIEDESSKVNIETAGGFTYDDTWDWNELPLGPATMRASADGATTFEYDTRVLDGLPGAGIGADKANTLWLTRTGAPGSATNLGLGLPSILGSGFPFYADASAAPQGAGWDGSFPGYAKVDDNGNLLALTLDGVDNDGDGLIDEGLNPAYPELIGRVFEGMDEPGEFQLHQPLRNLVAESGDIDDDLDGAFDEVGELGDRRFRTAGQMTLAYGVGPETYDDLEPFVTVHSMEENQRYRRYRGGQRLEFPQPAGPKLDFNYALAEDIARVLNEEQGYVYAPQGTYLAAGAEAVNFATGLRREATTVINDAGAPILTSDNELRAMQLAANIQDFRDSDFARTELHTTIRDPWWSDSLGGPERYIRNTIAGVETIRINEIMVRPVRRLEAEGLIGPLPLPPGEEWRFVNDFSMTGPPTPVPDFDYTVDNFDTAFGGTTSWFYPPGPPMGEGTVAKKDLALNPTVYADSGQPWLPYDILQIRISPSAEVPPGRYYLILNFRDETGTPTVTDPLADVRVALRYATAADTDFLQDLDAICAGAPDQGTADTLMDAVLAADAANVQYLDGGRAIITYEKPGGFNGTIQVPSYAPPATPQEFLYIALAFPEAPAANDTLALDYIELSQEPDHEWVEVVHIDPAGEPVDLSGWQLSVENWPAQGAPLTMTVPDGTQIAPGGSLLLGLNKFDDAFNPTAAFPKDPFYANGIGLARGPIPDVSGATIFWYDGISVPPIPDIELLRVAYNTYDAGFDSVFWPQVPYTDFVDLNADGVADASPDDTVQSTIDWIGPNSPDKAWDRIVEMQTALFAAAGGIYDKVLQGGVFPNYPEHDGIDNDEDNAVLTSDGVDSDGTTAVDNANEGVDEGRVENGWDVKGGLGASLPGAFEDAGVVFHSSAGNRDPESGYEYLGARSNRPEWKAFIERRLYPGDNVIVTLYEGPRYLGRVADRVTYTELDVVNRSIDDILDAPAYARAPLDPDNPSYWPADTMGIDFYKSLERKHPLYAGDLHGLANRWDATDGNYDDWHHGTRKFYRSLGSVSNWFGSGSATEYVHAIHGSPLRKNMFARVVEHLGGSGTEQRDSGLPDWLFKYPARLAGRHLTSPGDLTVLPHFAMAADVYQASEPAFETVTGIMGADQGGDLRVLVNQTALDPVVLTAGQAKFYPITPDPAGVSSTPGLAAWDRVNNFYPQAWTPVYSYSLGESFEAEVNPGGDEYPWLYLDGAPAPFQTYPFYTYFLFQTPVFPPGIDIGELQLRSPLHSRALFYMSGNPDTFAPTAPHVGSGASEAVFVWDGSDGLQNGEYDVYVITTEPLDRLGVADSAAEAYQPGAMLLVDEDGNGDNDGEFGYDVLRHTGGLALDEMAVDLEFYSDPDGDGVCWTNPEAYPVSTAGMDASSSYGSVWGAVPSTEGVIHYGTVKVENTYLALFLRNWAAPGRLNRFTRVVLAPRNGTPGLINVNTAAEQQIARGAPETFNPLWGLPGVLLAYDGVAPPGLTRDDFEVADIQRTDALMNSAYLLADNITLTGRALTAAAAQYDGRYYTSTADLFIGEGVLNAAEAWDTEAGFLEAATRFSRLGNMVTTRSDRFEITVLGQVGYVTETDPALLDWRDDEQFNVLGEKRMRIVYERK